MIAFVLAYSTWNTKTNEADGISTPTPIAEDGVFLNLATVQTIKDGPARGWSTITTSTFGICYAPHSADALLRGLGLGRAEVV